MKSRFRVKALGEHLYHQQKEMMKFKSSALRSGKSFVPGLALSVDTLFPHGLWAPSSISCIISGGRPDVT